MTNTVVPYFFNGVIFLTVALAAKAFGNGWLPPYVSGVAVGFFSVAIVEWMCLHNQKVNP